METYHGYVLTTGDAIKLFEACRLGLLPRVQRRLSEKERRQIRSGSVFVWDEREAGIRRWTDGKSWSTGRKSGSVMRYWEVESKRGDVSGSGQDERKSNSGRRSDQSHDNAQPRGVATRRMRLHLISYSRLQLGQSNLQRPSSDPSLRRVVPSKSIYPEFGMEETTLAPAHTLTPMLQLCGWRTFPDATPRGRETRATYPPDTHALQLPRLSPVDYNGYFAHAANNITNKSELSPSGQDLSGGLVQGAGLRTIEMEKTMFAILSADVALLVTRPALRLFAINPSKWLLLLSGLLTSKNSGQSSPKAETSVRPVIDQLYPASVSPSPLVKQLHTFKATSVYIVLAGMAAPESYRLRFADLQDVDNKRARLVEELLNEQENTKGALQKRELDLQNEQETRRRLQHETLVSRAEDSLGNKRPFVVLLIDANVDGYAFQDKYITGSAKGATDAADELFGDLQRFVRTLDSGANDLDIFVKAFANFSRLAAALVRGGRMREEAQVREFAAEFSSRHAFFDFVDVGGGKQCIDYKIHAQKNQVHLGALSAPAAVLPWPASGLEAARAISFLYFRLEFIITPNTWMCVFGSTTCPLMTNGWVSNLAGRSAKAACLSNRIDPVGCVAYSTRLDKGIALFSSQLPTSGDAFPSSDREQWPFAVDDELLAVAPNDYPGLRAEQRHLEPRQSKEWEVDSLVLMGAIDVVELEELRSALLSHRRQPQAV
ncbi:hypothetical protein PCL_01579 [Purpureocillium lilacinum]|uniref:DUF7923 domain-containing protein n=1 Tax=Purpureocillium lilacinum TaxID=33203 RepID=A0A2U3DNY9_PURLI|nr:hypothetical protein PCL_01579 [Purpureocillium lilacinum]